MRKPLDSQQVFARLGAVWQTARGERLMPARTDINPAGAGSALRYTALLDVVPGATMDFRYRLLGQHLIDSYGRNLTGTLHSQNFGHTATRPVFDALVRCVETKMPQTAETNFRNHNGTPCHAVTHVWPLSDDGGTVTGLLAGCIYATAPA